MKPKNQGSDKEIGVLEQPTPHILVVDDDEVIRLQLERLYTQSGYTAEVASSAEEALERLKAENIDLVITELIEINSVVRYNG